MAGEDARFEVVLAGEGGQGLVLAGVILGEAAVIEGLEATQCQWVLGSATRGSLSRSEVVISTSEIAFPRVRRADVLLALTPDALRRHAGMIRSDALVVVDRDLVPDASAAGEKARVIALRILAESNRLGFGRSSNVFALGVLVSLTSAVRPGSVEEALRRRFGEKSRANLEAFRAGARLATG